MKGPGTRVIGFESDDDEAIGGQQDDVTAGRVVEFGVEKSLVPGFIGLLEEGKIVTVQMHLLFSN